MVEQNGWATIQQLPGGDAVPVHIQNREDQTLSILLPPGASTNFTLGSLIEVQSPLCLYLGVVIGWRESVMLVSIEHVMDRGALEEVQSVWHGTHEG